MGHPEHSSHLGNMLFDGMSGGSIGCDRSLSKGYESLLPQWQGASAPYSSYKHDCTKLVCRGIGRRSCSDSKMLGRAEELTSLLRKALRVKYFLASNLPPFFGGANGKPPRIVRLLLCTSTKYDIRRCYKATRNTLNDVLFPLINPRNTFVWPIDSRFPDLRCLYLDHHIKQGRILVERCKSIAMPSASLTSFPFIFHVLVELPAAFAFIIFPSSTLSRPQQEAHAVIRQYGLLLLSTNIIASIFISEARHRSSSDDRFWRMEAWVAGSLAVYHLGPLLRAGSRTWMAEGRSRTLLEQPWVHALVHGITLISLAGRSLHTW